MVKNVIKLNNVFQTEIFLFWPVSKNFYFDISFYE